MDYSLPGSAVHGIFQARRLEWVAISYSQGIFLTQGSNPRLLHLLHWQVDSLPLSHLGSPTVKDNFYMYHSSLNSFRYVCVWERVLLACKRPVSIGAWVKSFWVIFHSACSWWEWAPPLPWNLSPPMVLAAPRCYVNGLHSDFSELWSCDEHGALWALC